MTLQEAWHQYSFFLPTIIQTRVARDYKLRVSVFILDKLEGFFTLHRSIFSSESFESEGSFLLQKCKHQLHSIPFQPTHRNKVISFACVACLRLRQSRADKTNRSPTRSR